MVAFFGISWIYVRYITKIIVFRLLNFPQTKKLAITYVGHDFVSVFLIVMLQTFLHIMEFTCFAEVFLTFKINKYIDKKISGERIWAEESDFIIYVDTTPET